MLCRCLAVTCPATLRCLLFVPSSPYFPSVPAWAPRVGRSLAACRTSTLAVHVQLALSLLSHGRAAARTWIEHPMRCFRRLGLVPVAPAAYLGLSCSRGAGVRAAAYAVLLWLALCFVPGTWSDASLSHPCSLPRHWSVCVLRFRLPRRPHCRFHYRQSPLIQGPLIKERGSGRFRHLCTCPWRSGRPQLGGRQESPVRTPRLLAACWPRSGPGAPVGLVPGNRAAGGLPRRQ